VPANDEKRTNLLDPISRYRTYLAVNGITDAGDRIAQPSDLDVAAARFFAYAGNEGLRLKAIVTPDGVVTPGGHTGDDWYGFLASMPDAMAAAEGVAWLETDAATPPDGLPKSPTVVLAPDRRPAAIIDPAQWALVIPPVLRSLPDCIVNFMAWLLPSGACVPERWTVNARKDAPAAIVYTSACEILAAEAGGAETAAIETTARAMRFLASGTDEERLWAVQRTGETGNRAAVPDLLALLADKTVGTDVRLLTATTLGHLSDPAAAVTLGTSLCADPAPEVRRACAQAIGRTGTPDAVGLLSAAVSHESDVTVRAEIVHALILQGDAARTVLERIAGSDADLSLRNLARGSLEALK
jgi:hypothetical protein